MHFRYAFQELAVGKSPQDSEWVIRHRRTRYKDTLGPTPKHYTDEQKEAVLRICIDADIKRIAEHCKFPDWLGYMGLVLAYMEYDTPLYKQLCDRWAERLKDIVPKYSAIHHRLENIVNDPSQTLTLGDLEACEKAVIQYRTGDFLQS